LQETAKKKFKKQITHAHSRGRQNQNLGFVPCKISSKLKNPDVKNPDLASSIDFAETNARGASFARGLD
jgi:hypothetical protein